MAVQLDSMSRSRQLRCQARRAGYLLAHEKERRLHACSGELLQDRRSASQVRSVVESHRDAAWAVDVVA